MRLALAGIALVATTLAAHPGITVDRLRVDYLENPTDVGATPVFSLRASADSVSAYRLRVSERDSKALAWDSREVASGEIAAVEYAGAPLKSATHYVWTAEVRDDAGNWSKPATGSFMTGTLYPEDWSGSSFVSPAAKPTGAAPLAYFRKKVTLGGRIRSAILATTSLGAFDVAVNGKSPSDALLKGGFTDRFKRRLSLTFDVTGLLREGENELVACVSASWWRDRIVHNRMAPFDTHANAFRAVLTVVGEDGRQERFVTDDSWQGAWDSNHESTIWDGESFKGELGKTKIDWGKTKVNEQFEGAITPMRGPHVRPYAGPRPPMTAYVYRGATGASSNEFGKVRIVRTVDASKIGALASNETLVVDCAQNWSAMITLAFSGAKGATVTIEPGEMLNDGNGAKRRGCDGPEGSVYRANLRNAKARFKCTSTGDGLERMSSKFSFYGFRYLSLRASADVEIAKLEVTPISSVPKLDTRFATGDGRLNRLLENIRWGMRGNYLSIPTDCPQRNERLGWTADTQIFAETALYLAGGEAASFLEKWLDDLRDGQEDDGSIGDIAPRAYVWNKKSVTGWADAMVIVPYRVWKMTGERRVLAENWQAMDRFMTMQQRHGGCQNARGQWVYGDWLSYEPNDDRLKNFLKLCFYVSDCEMMAEMAEALGRRFQALEYEKLAKSARATFAQKFVDNKGFLKREYGTQTALAYALRGKFFTGEAKDDVASRLVANIERNGNRLQTGFLGTAVLLDALADDAGRCDVAYALLLQDANPSWLYSVDQGATTIWERWNSYTKKDGFGPVTMNSFNHYAYGAVGAWMYRTMAGIRPGAAGFRHFTLAPKPDRRVASVDCVFDSLCGEIASKWRYDDDGSWTWVFTVPPNTTATVIAPDGSKPCECGPGTYTKKLTGVR